MNEQNSPTDSPRFPTVRAALAVQTFLRVETSFRRTFKCGVVAGSFVHLKNTHIGLLKIPNVPFHLSTLTAYSLEFINTHTCRIIEHEQS